MAPEVRQSSFVAYHEALYAELSKQKFLSMHIESLEMVDDKVVAVLDCADQIGGP